MKLLLSPRAQRDLAGQIGYLIDVGAAPAARKLERRVSHFLERTLSDHPKFGTPIEHRGLFETWIPGTKLVIWYRFSNDTIEIMRFWNTSQERPSSQ